MQQTYLQSLVGGGLIGLSAAILLVFNGRIAGVSGMVSGAIEYVSPERTSRILFLAGLLCGPLVYRQWFGVWPQVEVSTTAALMGVAGLLVGFGTRLGSGCTSGHGVCGLARQSPRSFTAVVVFLCTGIATVFVMRKFGIT
ncbi:MAG: YeeE/YedE family protein [Sphingomicrobium sp.]